MRNKINGLIKKIMLTATASLIGGNVAADVPSLPVTLSLDNSDKEIDIARKNNIIKGVYKIKRNGDAQLVASHRSHSSHRSHRSSSGYSTTPTKKSSSKSSSSKSKSTTNKSTTTPSSKKSSGNGYSTATPLMESKVKPTQNQILSLGDREIRNVNIDRGTDVTELVDKLLTLGYKIEKDNLDIDAENQTLYSPVIEKAVIEFKSKNGLPATGVVDKTTVQKLKSQQK